MSISLRKGGSLNLSKNEPGLKKAMIGLGWELKPGNPLDLDASIFMLGPNGKLPADEFFIFYNNLKSPDGSIQHTGDNRSGVGDGDDEMLLVNFSLVDSKISTFLICVTVHDAEARKHHFGKLKDAYVRLVDVETKREIMRYDLDEDFSESTGMEFGRVNKQDGEWIFHAIGEGNKYGLQGLVDRYA